ncbi:MAG: CDP-diacylglycerol--serine O-phosphatidyltransferase [Ignavibacteriae bacterium]|nr:CDP-diacylglycerol--serine O-phosphatidyltransferase [Ignavibacteriota bacterium]
MKITRAVVPSLFTVLNIFCGFLSILYTSQGKIELAAWFIILAAGFDAFDGVMARITRSSSQFGVELDSLSDVVSFGAAPSFLVYQAYLFNFGSTGILVSAMPLAFGAIRLARFNVQLVGFDKDYFKGLPIPSQAMTIVAFMLQYYSEGFGLQGWTRDALAPMVVLLSLLMVSNVRYDTLPKFTRRGLKEHPLRALFSVLGAIVVIASEGTLLFAALAAFIVFGVIRYIYEGIAHVLSKVEKEPDEENEVSSIDI